MTTKDKFTVIHNPSNWFLKFEVWISGEVSEYLGAGRMNNFTVTKCFKICRTEEAAKAVIQYQQDVARFKEGVQ